MNETLLNNYRILHVTVGSEQALVSLETGDVLVGPSEHPVLVAANVPRVSISERDAEVILGDEFTWNDVTSYLQTRYDWNNKNLP